jgi:NADPH:quinone reductase-like Zn-dependent oxidoreductase
MSGGAHTEYVAIDASAIALRPSALTVEQAAAVAVAEFCCWDGIASAACKTKSFHSVKMEVF